MPRSGSRVRIPSPAPDFCELAVRQRPADQRAFSFLPAALTKAARFRLPDPDALGSSRDRPSPSRRSIAGRAHSRPPIRRTRWQSRRSRRFPVRNPGCRIAWQKRGRSGRRALQRDDIKLGSLCPSGQRTRSSPTTRIASRSTASRGVKTIAG